MNLSKLKTFSRIETKLYADYTSLEQGLMWGLTVGGMAIAAATAFVIDVREYMKNNPGVKFKDAVKTVQSSFKKDAHKIKDKIG